MEKDLPVTVSAVKMEVFLNKLAFWSVFIDQAL